MMKVVRVDGAVEKVSGADADAYFKSRSRGSQIGAWASKQSQSLDNRFELEKRIAAFTAKYSMGEVPRPDFWEGYRWFPDGLNFGLKERSGFTTEWSIPPRKMVNG